MECPIWSESAVCDQAVEVWVPIYITAKCLDSRNHPRDSSVISTSCCIAIAQREPCRLHHLSYCLRCTTAQTSEELSVAPESSACIERSEIYPEYFRDGEDVVPVSDGF